MLSTRLRLASLISVCGLLVAGCSSDTNTSDTPQALPIAEVEAMFPQDISRWALPLDRFAIDIDTDWRANVLTLVAYGTCVREAGYADFPLPPGPPEETSATRNAWDRPLFTEKIAQTWGYADDERGYSGFSDEARLTYMKDLEAAGSKLPKDIHERCWTVGNALNKQEGVASVPEPRGLGLAAFEGAQKDPTVVASAKEWRTCMQPLGISDLPETPAEMPTPSIRPPTMDGPPPPPTAEQIRLAVADAQCRESSGYTKNYYEAEWRMNIDIVAKNYDLIKDAPERVATFRKTIDQELAARGY